MLLAMEVMSRTRVVTTKVLMFGLLIGLVLNILGWIGNNLVLGDL